MEQDRHVNFLYICNSRGKNKSMFAKGKEQNQYGKTFAFQA